MGVSSDINRVRLRMTLYKERSKSQYTIAFQIIAPSSEPASYASYADKAVDVVTDL